MSLTWRNSRAQTLSNARRNESRSENQRFSWSAPSNVLLTKKTAGSKQVCVEKQKKIALSMLRKNDRIPWCETNFAQTTISSPLNYVHTVQQDGKRRKKRHCNGKPLNMTCYFSVLFCSTLFCFFFPLFISVPVPVPQPVPAPAPVLVPVPVLFCSVLVRKLLS